MCRSLSTPEHGTLVAGLIALVYHGRTVSGIAEQLSRNRKTISTYRARVLEKLSLRNNADLARYAVKHQLLE